MRGGGRALRGPSRRRGTRAERRRALLKKKIQERGQTTFVLVGQALRSRVLALFAVWRSEFWAGFRARESPKVDYFHGCATAFVMQAAGAAETR